MGSTEENSVGRERASGGSGFMGATSYLCEDMFLFKSSSTPGILSVSQNSLFWCVLLSFFIELSSNVWLTLMRGSKELVGSSVSRVTT